MITDTISYEDAGVTLKGYLAYDETQTGKRPGILVMPEAFGLGKNAKARAAQHYSLWITSAKKRFSHRAHNCTKSSW